MIKQKLQSKLKYINLSRLALVLSAVILSAGLFTSILVGADQYDQQISQLLNQNAKKQSAVSALEEQATGYRDVINKLQTRINELNSAIDANLIEQDRLQRKIVQVQKDLEEQKRILGESIRVIYVEGQISTLEMLASSSNLNEFVDKRTYQNAVQQKIKETLDKVTALKLELQDKKTKILRSA